MRALWITVRVEAGERAVCGDESKCAIANALRKIEGIKRPKVGNQTIRLVIGDTKYELKTPPAAVRFVRDLDRYHEDGETTIVEESFEFKVNLNSKDVKRTPVVKMTAEDAAKLAEYNRTAPRRSAQARRNRLTYGRSK